MMQKGKLWSQLNQESQASLQEEDSENVSVIVPTRSEPNSTNYEN